MYKHSCQHCQIRLEGKQKNDDEVIPTERIMQVLRSKSGVIALHSKPLQHVQAFRIEVIMPCLKGGVPTHSVPSLLCTGPGGLGFGCPICESQEVISDTRLAEQNCGRRSRLEDIQCLPADTYTSADVEDIEAHLSHLLRLADQIFDALGAKTVYSVPDTKVTS